MRHEERDCITSSCGFMMYSQIPDHLSPIFFLIREARRKRQCVCITFSCRFKSVIDPQVCSCFEIDSKISDHLSPICSFIWEVGSSSFPFSLFLNVNNRHMHSSLSRWVSSRDTERGGLRERRTRHVCVCVSPSLSLNSSLNASASLSQHPFPRLSLNPPSSETLL